MDKVFEWMFNCDLRLQPVIAVQLDHAHQQKCDLSIRRSFPTTAWGLPWFTGPPVATNGYLSWVCQEETFLKVNHL